MEGGEMRACRKRKESGEEGGGPAKIAAISAVEGDDDLKKIQAEEDMLAEVMKWLEEEIGGGGSPSSSPDDGGDGWSWSYYQSPSFVTINGNEESCGSSFSDAASTVMASVDTRGSVGLSYFFAVPPERSELQAAVGFGPWSVGCATAPVAEEEEDDDDAWLSRVLRGPEFDLEESFL